MSGLDAQDQWDIRQVLALYGHLVDSGEWEELGRVFAPDAEILHGGRVFVGPDGAAEFERSRRGAAVHAHHTVNTAIREAHRDDHDGEPDRAVVWSRFVLVTEQQTARGGDALDTLVRSPAGWRIVRRRVTDRNTDRADGDPYRPGDGESFATWIGAS